MFDFDEASDKDAGRVRVTEIDNGNTVTATCSDPYGFWTLKLGKGALPHEYQGQYTTYDQADQAVKKYLADRGRAIADANAEPRPVLQTKPGYEKTKV